MRSPEKHSERVFGLDAMRAAAILMVLASHTWPQMIRGHWWFASGVLGVELFFVLSGFLIGGILLRLAYADRLETGPDLVSFWRRRWYRTLPNYYLFLFARMAWDGCVVGNPVPLLMYDQYLPFLQNFTSVSSNFFGETWSLAIEEWFYLLFPFVLWALLRVFKQRDKACVTAILIFFVIPQVLRILKAFSMRNYDPVTLEHLNWDLVFRRVVVLRLDVLMYGVAAAFMAMRRPVLWERLIRFWLLGPVLLAVAALSLAYDWPVQMNRPIEGLLLWPCIAVGFTLVLMRASLISEAKGRVAAAIRFVAAISYALYLCQGLVVLMMYQFCGQKSLLHLVAGTWSWFLAAWVFSFLLASAVHYGFEKPIMNLRDRSRAGMTGLK